MKTQVKFGLGVFLISIASGNVSAQELKTDNEKQVRIHVVEDENGKVKSFDTTFSMRSDEEIMQLMKDKGIQWSANEENVSLEEILKQHNIEWNAAESDEVDVKVLGDNSKNKKVFIRKISKDEMEGEQNMVKVINVTKNDGDENGEEVEVKVFFEDANGDFSEGSKQIKFEGKDGKTHIIKLDDLDKNALFEFNSEGGDDKGEHKVIVKTITLDEDGNGNLSKTVNCEAFANTMIFILDKGEKELASDETSLLPTKIEENSLDNLKISKLKLYPNPTSGNFNMSFKSKEPRDFDLSITDAKGNILYQKNLKGFEGKFEEEFDWTSQPKGMYFFSIRSENETESRKIILQ